MNKKIFIYFLTFATVVLTTRFIVIPLSATGGYFNLSDIAVVFSGLLIAHLVGERDSKVLLAAIAVTGLGTAAADIWSGYAFYAPVTFIAKGFEGAFAYISYKKKGISHLLLLLAGGILMVASYFVFQIFFLGNEGGLKVALTELFPANTIQLFGGLIGGRLLFLIAQKVIK